MREYYEHQPSIYDRFPQLKEIPSDRFPHHIFIIRTSGEMRTSDIGWINGPQT